MGRSHRGLDLSQTTYAPVTLGGALWFPRRVEMMLAACLQITKEKVILRKERGSQPAAGIAEQKGGWSQEGGFGPAGIYAGGADSLPICAL